jgi:methylated-DNA-[protein]-cysteine S-methyltransferase
MPGEIPVSGEVAATPAIEPIRVAVPSRLGTLGVEFVHTSISRILIAPGLRERKLYFPLSDYEDSEFLDEVFGRISEYLAGARRSLDLDYDLGPAGLDGFARRVLRETVRTGYGKTRTYKEVAEAAGRPEAYRQVVSILEKNPLPLIVPCHRILPSKQGIGGYVGGAARKRLLLRLEKESAASLPL